MNGNCWTQNCCLWTALGMLVWWFLAAGLFTFTWNRVVGELSKVKDIKFWQSLVLLFTIGFLFCAPAYITKRCDHGGCGRKAACCRHAGCDKDGCNHDGENPNCPWEGRETHSATPAPAHAPASGAKMMAPKK